MYTHTQCKLELTAMKIDFAIMVKEESESYKRPKVSFGRHTLILNNNKTQKLDIIKLDKCTSNYNEF